MKAIILAAGSGTRLNKYTKDLPKGMLMVFGKPIIQHQIESYIRNGITDITIVKGYCSDKITFESTREYINTNYSTTNMIESLFCAEKELYGDVIISYADVIFEDSVLISAIKSTSDIGVVVDSDWKDYWMARYDKVDFDTESLKINSLDEITELGISDPPLDEIDGRYVGMIRLSEQGANSFRNLYFKAQKEFHGKIWLGNRLFEKIYMTDFLQELINQNYTVKPIWTKRAWLEFDTNEDYERTIDLHNKKSLSDFYNLFVEN